MTSEQEELPILEKIDQFIDYLRKLITHLEKYVEMNDLDDANTVEHKIKVICDAILSSLKTINNPAEIKKNIREESALLKSIKKHSYNILSEENIDKEEKIINTCSALLSELEDRDLEIVKKDISQSMK